MDHVAFGAFNPRFYGVSVFVGGEDRRKAMTRHWIENGARSAGAPEPSLADIFLAGVPDHEMRHFHDFLVSPMGTVTMGLRMQASINGFQAFKLLAACPGKFVPVPFTRWLHWDRASRRQWIRETGSLYGVQAEADVVALEEAPLPARNSTQEVDAGSVERGAVMAASAAAQAYASMERLSHERIAHAGLHVAALDMYEAVAHLVQVQALWTGEGETAAARFMAHLLASDSPHLQPLRALFIVLHDKLPQIRLERLAEVFTWILLGPCEAGPWGGASIIRYFQVLEKARTDPACGLFTSDVDSARLFDALDSSTGSIPWRESLAGGMAGAARRSAEYGKAARVLQGGYYDDLFALAALWHAEQRESREIVRQDPGALARPLRYVTELKFRVPFVEFRLGSEVHEWEEPVRSPRVRAITFDAEGRRVLSYIQGPDTRRSEEELDAVFSSRILSHMVDFVFTDEPVGDLYEHWCRGQVEATIGKKLLSVF